MRIPEPHVGLVISYSYLWRNESARGAVEGRKDRPCGVVLVTQQGSARQPVVTVAPITHSPPADPSVAIEIPRRVKQFLGLDTERSWIILDEFNEFAWPGFDLRPVSGSADTCVYGDLPPKLFEQIATRIGALKREHRTSATTRDED